MISIAKTMISYYATKHKKLLLSEPPSTITDRSRTTALILHQHVKFDLKELAGRPDLLSTISQAMTENSKTIGVLERSIMDSTFFDNKSNEEIVNFFANLTADDPLRLRIEADMLSNPDCSICYDAAKDKMFGCGHSVCASCLDNMTICPFCRKEISGVADVVDIAGNADKINVAEETDTRPVWTTVHNVAEFIDSRLKALFSKASGSLTPGEETEISLLVDNCTADVLKHLHATNLKSEELRMYVIGKLVAKNQTKDDLAKLTKYVTTPDRTLRLLAVLNGHSADTNEGVLLKLTKGLRKWIMKIVDLFDDKTATVYEQFSQHQEIWKLIFKAIHTSDFKKLTKAMKFVNIVRGNTSAPIKSVVGTMNGLFDKKSDDLFDFFAANTGHLYRNLMRLCCTFPTKVSKWELLPTLLMKLRPEQLQNLTHIFSPSFDFGECTEHDDTCESYFTSKGSLHWKSDGRQFKNFPDVYKIIVECNLKMIESCNLKMVDFCVVDDRNQQLSLKQISSGKAEKPTNWGPMPCDRGDEISLNSFPDDTMIVVGTYWKNGAERVDLDLTVTGHDDEFNRIDECSYSKLSGFSNKATHSGDIVDAPEGASEYITFNLNDLVKANPSVSLLTLMTFSYNSVSYDDMTDAQVFIGIKSSTIKGDGPFSCKILDACHLRGKALMNLSAYIDLKTLKLVFTNLNIKPKKGGVNASWSRNSLTCSTIKHFMLWMKSRSAPAKWYNTILPQASVYGKVMMRTPKDGDKYFEKRDGETTIAFLDRLTVCDDVDTSPQRLTDRLAGECECKDDDQIIYYGDADFVSMSLPDTSLIVSHHVPTGVSQMVHCDDPRKVMHLV